MLFAGALDKPGTVSVNGVPAVVNPQTTNFTGYATVNPGTNVVQVVAADSYGNSRTNRYQIVLTNNGVAQAITYDLNGNQVSSVTSFSTNTYEWDGADRLTAINSGTNRSEFTYDGLGRRVQIVEKQNGAVVSTKKFVWVGMAISEERDSTGATVTKRFFGQGQVNGTTNLYYARDHLGNVREMTDGTGVLRARYDYDPYGRRTKLAGDLDADFAFTGHYYHAASGLYLAPYRAYDANAARWLSRDPISETGGLNLYGYIFNNPVNGLDPLGLSVLSAVGNFAVGLGVGFAGAVVVTALVASGTVVGTVAAVAIVGYGFYQLGIAAQEILTGEDPYTGNKICTEDRIDLAAGILGAIIGGGFGAKFGAAEGGTAALQPMPDAAFQTGTIRNVAGYELGGNAGLAGNTYNVNLWGLYATENAQGPFALVNALKGEASAAGASQISITGNAMMNQGLLNISPRVASRLGFQFQQVNPTTILLQGAVH